jgi:phosphate:Na+ symporter
MRLFQVFEALGGLGLFILGMKTMSDGLQRLAGGRFRRFIETLVGNRLSAALTGSCLSSVLQSSGAASILIIGFVNAGLLSLYQALGMLIGTGLGTALAVQFIAFKISFLSLPAIFFGVALRLFSKRRRWTFSGEILLGFGLLFFGLEVMEARFAPLGETAIFQGYHSIVSDWRVVSVLTGAVLTFVTQSGSAAIGIIIALAAGGVIGFPQAAAMIPGEVLGTAALAGIGSIGGTPTARRTVVYYAGIAIVSIVLLLLFFPLYLKLVAWLTTGDGSVAQHLGKGLTQSGTMTASRAEVARALANGYTLFSVLLAVLFLPLIGFFARSAANISPGKEGEADIEPRSCFLDFRVINTPTLAFLQAGNELKRMAQAAHSMLSDTTQQFYEFNTKKASLIKQKENLLDVLQKDISAFLVALARQPLDAEIAAEIPVLLSTVNDLEEIGDNCEYIMDCLRRKKEGDVYFSDTAMAEIKALADKVTYLTALTVDCLDSLELPTSIAMAELYVELLRTAEELKTNHLLRLSKGACTVIAGLLFMDIVSAFTKIGEYALTIIDTERGIR